MATEGTFILTDIGGYTSFLSGVGIEHGKEITEDLLNTILRCNRGRWKLANVEGDCIFFYREGREPPHELVDHIRDIYKTFSPRTIDIAERAACPCGACTRTGELSLKFIVHAGEFDTQKIGNRTELVGTDVVLAHRLLKNSVPLDEYVIVTNAYATDSEAFGLPSVSSTDSLEGVGDVSYKHLDLQPVRDELRAANRVFVTKEEARIAIEVDINASPERIWRALVDPDEFIIWAQLQESEELPAPGGTCSMHRCVASGGRILVRLVVAEDEEQRRITEKLFFSRFLKDVYATTEVRPTNGGAHVNCYGTSRPAIPVISALVGLVLTRIVARGMRRSFQRLKDYCEGRLNP